MLSQAGIARTWGPGCYHGRKLAITLNGGGVVTVRPAIGDAVLALDAVLRQYGYRTRKRDTGAYVCRQKTGGNGVSNHSFGTALDLNWSTNPYGRHLKTDMPRAMVAAICAIRTNNGAQVWNWGGNWSGNKDAMHYEIVCRPADIATGIRRGSVPQMPAPLTKPVATHSTPVPVIPLDEGDDEMVRIVRDARDGAIYKILGKPGVLKVKIPGKGSQLAHALAELDYDAAGKPLGGKPATVPNWDGDDLDGIRTI